LLRAGTAVLRVSDVPNDGCAKWKVRFGAAAMQWVIDPAHAGLRLRGLLCAVETDGEVAVGDRLSILR
jgi:MOSC domain-containing protein YiiM